MVVVYIAGCCRLSVSVIIHADHDKAGKGCPEDNDVST
jgi:hypothetical protein